MRKPRTHFEQVSLTTVIKAITRAAGPTPVLVKRTALSISRKTVRKLHG